MPKTPCGKPIEDYTTCQEKYTKDKCSNTGNCTVAYTEYVYFCLNQDKWKTIVQQKATQEELVGNFEAWNN